MQLQQQELISLNLNTNSIQQRSLNHIQDISAFPCPVMFVSPEPPQVAESFRSCELPVSQAVHKSEIQPQTKFPVRQNVPAAAGPQRPAEQAGFPKLTRMYELYIN